MKKRNAAWTVMVYLAGDSSLTSECLFALTETKHAAFGKRLNVIAQHDPCKPHLPTHRQHINKRSLTFNELKNVFRRVKQDRNHKFFDILAMEQPPHER